MEPVRYFNRHMLDLKPLKESVIEGRDFIMVPKGVWRYFQA